MQKYFEVDLKIHFKWCKDQPKDTPTIPWKCILKSKQKYLKFISEYTSNGTNTNQGIHQQFFENVF